MADLKADSATKQRVQGAFLKRVQQIILKTRHPAVKANYEAWLHSLELPLPSPIPSATTATTLSSSSDGQPGPSTAPASAPVIVQ